MTSIRYLVPVLMPFLSLGTLAVGSVSMAYAIPERAVSSAAPLTSETIIVAQVSASRAADCGQIKQFIAETSRSTALPQLTNDPNSVAEKVAQIDAVIKLIDGYSSRLQAMPLTDPQIKQLRTRYVSGFQEGRQFLLSLRNAVAAEDEAALNQAMEKLAKAFATAAELDKQLQKYCGFSFSNPNSSSSPSRSPSRQQPTRRPAPQAQRPSSAAQRNAQTQQLNTQLQAAVNAKDWNRAIQIVDRLIVLHPERANELRQYRARLVQIRNAQ